MFELKPNLNQNVFITIKIRFFSNLNCWFKIKIWIDPNCNQTCSLTKLIKDRNNTGKSIKNDNVPSNEGTISNIYPKNKYYFNCSHTILEVKGKRSIVSHSSRITRSPCFFITRHLDFLATVISSFFLSRLVNGS